MGMLFNSPDTVQMVRVLNRRYDDSAHGANGLQAHRGDAATYLNFGTYPTLRAVANQLGLLPGHSNARWLWFLDFIDGLPGPIPLSTIGTDLRNAIAAACNDANCDSIEFFAVPDTNISLHLGYVGLGGGRYSRIITLYTTLIDSLGTPPARDP
jgi:hypothetical protein